MRRIDTKNTKHDETFIRGGGGGSSRVLWPEYLHRTHRQALYGETTDTPTIPPVGGVLGSVESGLQKNGGNPFAGANSYDPSKDLELSKNQYDRLQGALNQFEHKDQWAENNIAALAAVNTSVLAENQVGISVDEFEHSQLQVHADEARDLNAANSAAGRIPSTAYSIGVAIQEKSFQRGVAKKRAALMAEQHDAQVVAQTSIRNNLNIASVVKIMTLHRIAFDSNKLSWLKTKLHSMQLNRNIHNVGRRQHWDLWLYKAIQNMFAAPSGQTVTPALDKKARGKARGKTTTDKLVRWMKAVNQDREQQDKENEQREQEREAEGEESKE